MIQKWSTAPKMIDPLKDDPKMICWTMIQSDPLKDVPKMIHWRMFQQWSTEGSSHGASLGYSLALPPWSNTLCLSHPPTPSTHTHRDTSLPHPQTPSATPQHPHLILSLEILTLIGVHCDWLEVCINTTNNLQMKLKVFFAYLQTDKRLTHRYMYVYIYGFSDNIQIALSH